MRVTPWLACLAFGACGTGEGASYIVLDPAARAALIEAEAGGRHHSGALPLEVEGDELELVGPRGRLRLPIAANRAYQVDGEGRAREWVLGEEVRTDVVEVGGSATAVRNLAWALGTRVPQPWNGRWRLEGQDALVRLSWMGDLADISEVALVLTDQARARARSDLDPAGDRPPARPLRTDEGLEALVGLYTSDGGPGLPEYTLFLDAEGGFSLQKGCDPAPVVGTYRRSGGAIRLFGTDLAVTESESGRLEAPGLVFSGGEEP
jgi:hypothetical protein